MNKIRFIHAADLHLDSPFKGLNYLPAEIFNQIRNSTIRSFRRIVDIAINEKVDFLLLAGDLFDLEQRSLIAQARLRQEFQRLQEKRIAVYVIHGNHDYMTESQKSFRYPENVEIFKETVEAKPFIKEGKHLANIYGFSYSKRHITQNMTSHYIKENSAVPFHLGLLHGNLSGREDHDPYAPFTIPELLEQDFDYWALGHIHKREILHSHPPIVYPGNIQGRSKKETGEKGCYIVELTEGGNPELSFIETAPIQWTSLEVSINNLQTMDQLIETVKQSMEVNRREETGILTELAFTGSGELHAALQDENYCEDLVVLLNEGEEKNASFHYVYSLKSLTTAAYSKSELKEKSFYRDFYSIVEQTENLDSVLSALYRQSEARHYLDALDTMEQKAILEEAEQWLVTRFLESEKR